MTVPRMEVTPRARLAGLFLIICGVIGVVAGIVPLVLNVMRLLGCTFGLSPEGLESHGVAAMGLSVPWAILSCWDGTYLGSLLLAGGIGWRRGWAWAPLVTFLYAVHGVMVDGLDVLIFVVAATPGPMRSRMIVLDSIAGLVALSVLVGVVAWWRRQRAASA
ncbi:MAG: hypothetical protein ACLF0G_15035 [Candidatus Brocadiia bacterium]